MADMTTNDAAERPVMFSVELMERLATRTDDGYRIRVDWGEPGADGFYTPTLTVDYTDSLAAAERQAGADEERGRIRAALMKGNETVTLFRDEIPAILDAELVDAALAAERHATVERIREAVMTTPWGRGLGTRVFAILDAETER